MSELAVLGGKPAVTLERPLWPHIGEPEIRDLHEAIRISQTDVSYLDSMPAGGPIAILEARIGEYLGRRHAVTSNSCTAAIQMALYAAGVGAGDEVVVSPYTWPQTVSPILHQLGTPVFADIDPDSFTMRPDAVEAAITERTKAILVVHIYGHPADMDPIVEIGRRHGLPVIEDCAQGIGASYHGRRLGSIGDVGCFSLQFSKIITTGEGGMVTTSDRQIWQRAFMFHDVAAWNRLEIPDVEILWGANFRMSEIPAAIGLVQLGRLPGIVAAARARKQLLLAGIGPTAAEKGVTFRDLPDPDGDTAISLTMFLETPAKAQAAAHALNAENISAGVLYRPDRRDIHVYAHWLPVLTKRAWTDAGGPWRWAGRNVAYSPDMCPRSLDILARSVVLSVDPSMTNTDVEETIDGVTKVLDALA